MSAPIPHAAAQRVLPNVIISPHVSGVTPDYNERSAKVFAENLRRYVVRKPLLNVLDRAEGY